MNVHNLSHDNGLDWHENEPESGTRFHTKTRFETEAKDNSEMPYCRPSHTCVVSSAAVFWDVMKRSPQALRDIAKNGCGGDYPSHNFSYEIDILFFFQTF